MQSALTEAKQLNVGYSKLMSFLQVNQPCTETHMQSLEQEVRLAKQQCEDLKAYRMKLYEETEKIEKEQIKSLKEKVQALKAQRATNLKRIKEQKILSTMTANRVQEADRENEKLHGRAAKTLATAIRRSLSSVQTPPHFAADRGNKTDSHDVVNEILERESKAKSGKLSIASMVEKNIRNPAAVDMVQKHTVLPRTLSPSQTEKVKSVASSCQVVNM